MYATNLFEDAIINLMREVPIRAPETLYLALFMTNPGDEGEGYEVNYEGYTRLAINFSEPFEYSTGLCIQNAEELIFTESPVTLGSVTHIGIMNQLNGGDMLLYGELDTSLSIQAGVTPIFRVGSIKWIWTGNLSNYYRNKIMRVFLHEDVNGFLPWLGFCNGDPDGAGAEFSGYGYARVQFQMSGPVQQPNGTDMCQNTLDIVSPESTGNWGTMSYVCIYDSETNGQPFAIIPLGTSFVVSGQTSIGFRAGSLRFSVN